MLSDRAQERALKNVGNEEPEGVNEDFLVRVSHFLHAPTRELPRNREFLRVLVTLLVAQGSQKLPFDSKRP